MKQEGLGRHGDQTRSQLGAPLSVTRRRTTIRSSFISSRISIKSLGTLRIRESSGEHAKSIQQREFPQVPTVLEPFGDFGDHPGKPRPGPRYLGTQLRPILNNTDYARTL